MQHVATATLAAGVTAGLLSGAFNAVAFLISRHHATTSPGGGLRLLVHAHLVMAAVCLPVAWLLWPRGGIDAMACLPPLAGSIGCYLAGQAALVASLRRADASRVVPLLALKIVALALIVTCLPGERLDVRQWVAVGLCVVAATALQGRRDPVPAAVAGLMLAACIGFAGADLLIVRVIDVVHAADPARSRLWACGLSVAVTYVACGLVAVPFLTGSPPRGRDDWRAAAWYGLVWLVGMATLYVCFGLLGAVFGNVLLSSRGLFAVVFGAVLAHRGWHELEQRVDRATLVRRIIAALFMTGAIALYVIDVTR
jgi:drug/metabolite transporter (DMT)-like permease